MSHDRASIGWDIGGAHLKVAYFDNAGRLRDVVEKATPIWQGIQTLHQAIDELERQMPLAVCDHYVTMTAELVDLFDDRVQGVTMLAHELQSRLAGNTMRVFAGRKGFVDANRSADYHHDIASANWYATAQFVAACEPDALLLDIGSTTTDMVLCRDGAVDCRGYSDRERLAAGELVYTGVVRTPLMAVIDEVPLGGDWQAVANEHFATLADVYRIVGELPQHADLHPTADGRDKGCAASMRRLARMLGCDLDDETPQGWSAAAAYIAERHAESLLKAIRRQLSRHDDAALPIIGAGVGQFLVEKLAMQIDRRYIPIQSLPGLDSPDANIAVCAPAVAVGKLGMMERLACAC